MKRSNDDAVPKEMGPSEIVRDAEDMVKNYPQDRLRLTGRQILDLVAFVQAASVKEKESKTNKKPKATKPSSKVEFPAISTGVLVDGMLCVFGSAWEAEEFHDHMKSHIEYVSGLEKENKQLLEDLLSIQRS